MTENKRFELEYVRGKPNFWDNVVDLADCYLTCEDVVDLLNEQHEENKELKARKYPIPIEDMDKYLNYGDIKDLQYANEIIESQRKTIREQHETIQFLQIKEKERDTELLDLHHRVREQHETIEYLKPLANENTQYIADIEDDIATFKEEIKELTDALNQRTQQLDDYGLKVQETLQEAYNQNARHSNPIALSVCLMIKNIAKELGVELK